MQEQIIRSIKEEKLIAIVRGVESEKCIRIAQALYDGGIRLMEITYDQKHPEGWEDTARTIGAVGKAFEGKMYDFIYSSQMLWSGSYTSCARNVYTKILTDRLPMLRSLITSEQGLPSKNGTFRPFRLASGGGSVPVQITSVLPKDDVVLKGVPFTLAKPVSLSVPEVNDNSTESVKLALHDNADSLVFLKKNFVG